jgi:hypothetical protein
VSERRGRLLDPHFLSKLTKLDLTARLVVEGFLTGLHRSPYHGFSVEFAEHRQYMPGDPLRHLDWKVLGSPTGSTSSNMKRRRTSARCSSSTRARAWDTAPTR